MFRIPILIAIALLIAFGGATASAIYALKATVGFGSIRLGAWTAWPDAQKDYADPYAKAHRARAGKLLLGDAEGLVFVAKVDSQGDTLVTRCEYTITGITPPARFWTLHTTRDDDQIMAVDANFPAAYHSHNILKGPGGAFTISTGHLAKPGNWLTTPFAEQRFQLVLTLFDSPTAGSSRLIQLQMPDIIRGKCRDG